MMLCLSEPCAEYQQTEKCLGGRNPGAHARRTIQDVLKALPGLGIELTFIQDGRRHNDGYYKLSDWGPFDLQWVESREQDLITSLAL